MIIHWRPSTDANFYQISDAEITSGLALNVDGIVRYVHRVTINQGGNFARLSSCSKSRWHYL